MFTNAFINNMFYIVYYLLKSKEFVQYSFISITVKHVDVYGFLCCTQTIAT